MKSQDWEKIKDAFAQVLEQPRNSRADWLKETYGADARVFTEVKSLLAAHDETEKLIEKNAFDVAASVAADGANYAGKQFGNYRIIREIGRGGMGAVFLAERIDGAFNQKVALKIVRQSFADAELEKRFRRERQILASLNHPNIAKLLDGGVSEAGELFLAMEYIEGRQLLEYAFERDLEIKERLDLFLKICSAVAHAHWNLIVHRDIKPSNILVTKEGEPKLLDFGLAKILSDARLDISQTETAFRAFTPAYASPEQMRGEPVATASDVYSLGVVFYELLSGERPFHFENKSYQEILRSLDTLEPPRPSSVVSSSKFKAESSKSEKETAPNDERRTTNDEQTINPQSAIRNSQSLRGDLDNIALMALRKEPERRYQSVEEFARDIERHLSNLPILARPQTVSYRAAKFVQRNKFAVSAVAIIISALAAGLSIALWQTGVARAERDRAERRFDDVRQLSNSLLFEITPKIERLQGATEAREILLKRALEYLDSLAQEAEGDLSLQSELAAAYEKIGDLQGNPSNPNLIDSDAASASYEKARMIRLKLAEKNPSDFERQRNLAENHRVSGRIYGQANDLQSESEHLQTALQIYEKLLGENPASNELKFALAQVNHDIGRNRTSTKRYADSVAYFENAIASLEEMRQKNPNDAAALKLLGDCYCQLALSLSWEERQKEAEAKAAKAIEIFETALKVGDPNDGNLRAGIWSGHWYASLVYEEQNDVLSHEHALKALQIIEEIVRQDAANIRAKQQLSKTLSQLGQTSNNTGRADEAVIYLEKARATVQGITENRSKNRALKVELSSIFMGLGDAKSKQGKFAEALADFQRAVEIHQEIQQQFAGDLRVYRNLAVTYESIAETHEKISGGKSPAARENYQKALDLLLLLERQNALAEFDRKFLERVKTNVQKSEK